MIAPRWPLLAVALLSALISRRRPSVRPVAVTLCSLAAIDFARLFTWAHFAEWRWGRVHGTLGLLWPGVYAALAWHAWRVVKADLTTAVALGPFAVLAALPWAPVAWTQHPHAWAALLLAPHAFAPLVATYALASHKDEGPGAAAPSPSLAPPSVAPPERSPYHLREMGGPATTVEGYTNTTPDPSRATAFVLALSGLLDVTIGALAPGAAWVRAAPLAWATWIAVGLVLLVSAKRA